MRILQLIDSLETGGAERMAVNYANALVGKASFSGLVTTRKEGDLKTQLHPEVEYLFLNRTTTLDWKAVLKLRAFVVKNKVNLIHAHSSSFLLAILAKLTLPKIKIVWHDHYGNSEFLEKRARMPLQLGSLFFHRIIAVNSQLESWSLNNLFCKKVVYLPNFVLFEKVTDSIVLQGKSGHRILCLANLRPQKNHFMLLDAAKNIKNEFPDWTFHLIGKDFLDDYSTQLYHRIKQEELENTVFFYGATSAVASAIQQSDIGVLTSLSEGLPVSLLEYGYFGLPAVVTAVGELPKVIHAGNGILIPSENVAELVKALEKLIRSSDFRSSLGEKLKTEVHALYTQNSIIQKYLNGLNYENQ